MGDDGILRADGYLSRTGVQVYHNADGSPRREYRPEREVFDDASLRSIALVPVTDDHPPEMLTSKTARKYAVGTVGEQVRKDGDKVAAPIVIYDEDTIRKMKSGKVALSVGYTCDLINEPGTAPNGEKYDAVQTNIRGNHVAIVDYARAGSEVRVRMDSARGGDVAWARSNSSDNPPRRATMADNKNKQRKDDQEGLLHQAAEELAKSVKRADDAEGALASETKRADEAEGRVEALETENKQLREGRIDEGEVTKLKGEIKILQQRLATAEKARVDAESPNRLKAAVRQRVRIEKAAEAILTDTSRLDNLTDREIMSVVVEKLQGFVVPADRSDDYVRARFDAAIEAYGRGSEALGKLREAIVPREPVRTDSANARATMIDRQQNAWKQPLNGAAAAATK